MTLAIDSNPFIWGIKKTATAGQEDNIRKAEEFFKWADFHKYKILIPTLVVAEILVSEPEEEISKYLKIINERFIVAQFDQRAARIYSRILHGRSAEIKANYQALEITKQQMKVDHIIIATAIANNVDAIISHDNGVKAFSKGLLRVERLRDSYIYGEQQQPTIFTQFS